MSRSVECSRKICVAPFASAESGMTSVEERPDMLPPGKSTHGKQIRQEPAVEHPPHPQGRSSGAHKLADNGSWLHPNVICCGNFQRTCGLIQRSFRSTRNSIGIPTLV